jgi:hypothetical protein
MEQRRPWTVEPTRMWRGAEHVDVQRLVNLVSWRSTGAEPVLAHDKDWILVVDIGLNVFATIACVNTGDVWEVGRGAYQHIKQKYDVPMALLQRQFSALVSTHATVVPPSQQIPCGAFTEESTTQGALASHPPQTPLSPSPARRCHHMLHGEGRFCSTDFTTSRRATCGGA